MTSRSAINQAMGLAGWLLASFVAAGLGGWASANAAGFYGQLLQPSWAPPAWLFGPVWSLLFVLMALSAWLVWRVHGFASGGTWTGTALWVYLAQLVVNALWSWLFFAWQLGAIALADIGLLWLLIACTIGLFWRLQRVAALLLLPYLAWVSFAGALNFALWRLNPGLLASP